MRASLVLYESGPRLADSLAALADGLGDRPAAVIREITKLHEECVTGSLGELAARYAEPRQGRDRDRRRAAGRAQRSQRRDARRGAAEALSRLSPSRAAAEVALALGVPKKRAYARALELARDA